MWQTMGMLVELLGQASQSSGRTLRLVLLIVAVVSACVIVIGVVTPS